MHGRQNTSGDYNTTSAPGSHARDSVSPWSEPQRTRVPPRHSNAHKPGVTLRGLAPHEPPRPSKTAGQQPYRGFTCSYLCGPWGSLLQPKTPGRIPGEATLQTGRPWDTRSPTRQAAETRTYTTPQTGPHRKARHPLPGRSDGVRTGRPVRNRPQNSQPDPTTPPHSDAPNQPATRPSRGLPPTFRTADLIRSAPEWRG